MELEVETNHANTYQKKVGVAILISDRADFKTIKGISDEGHYIKGPNLQKSIMILSMYVLNISYETKTNRTERRNRCSTHSWRLQHSSIRNEQIQQAENHYRHN